MRRNGKYVIGVVVAATAVACGSGGGGEASKSAQTVLSDARHAATSATSVHVAGTATVQGQQVPLDLRVAAGRAVGSSTFGGTKVDIVRSGDNIYVRGAQQVLGGFLGPKAAARIGTHWLAVSTSLPQLQQFVGTTDYQQLITQALTPKQAPSKAGTRTEAGQKVIVLRGFGTDGKGTLLVAASGTPRPVRLDADGGSLTFKDWDKPVTVTVPTDVVQLADVMK